MTDIHLLNAVRAELKIDAASPVLVQAAADGSVDVLAVASGVGDLPPCSEFADAEGCVIRAQLVPMATLEAFVEKAARNISSVPFYNVLRGISQRMNARRRWSSDEYPGSRLPPLAPSGRPARLLAEVGGKVALRLMPATRGKTRTKAHIAYMTEAELRLLEQLQTWRVVQGRARLDTFWCQLHDCALPFQLAALNFVFLQRTLEDVEGLVGFHMESTVAVMARVAFQTLAQTLAGSHGVARTSEASLLEWSETIDPALREDFVKGLFPAPEQVGAHVDWLRAVESRYVHRLRSHWLLRGALPVIVQSVPTNTARTAKRNIPDSEYALAPPVADVAQLETILQGYGTSMNELLRLIPLPADATLRLTGSIVEGRAHARSDLDFVVLTERVPDLAADTASSAEGHWECQLGTTRSGNLICAEYMTDVLLQDLQKWMRVNQRALTILRDPRSPSPDLLWATDRLRSIKWDRLAMLFQRAVLSLAVREQATARRWRDSLSLDCYRACVASSYRLEYEELCRQIPLRRGTSPLVTLATARNAWEHLLTAYLASRNRFVWRKRWILHAIAQLGDADLLSSAKRGLFPRPAHAADYVEWMQSQAAPLLSWMDLGGAGVTNASGAGDPHEHACGT